MKDGDGKIDKSPSLHWPIPNIILGSGIEQKPVLIKIEYKIDPTKKREFERIMKEWSRIRKRDGSLHWGLYYDGENPSKYIETFIAESWEGHLCQHERITVADRKIENSVKSFHIDKNPPSVSHFIAESL